MLPLIVYYFILFLVCWMVLWYIKLLWKPAGFPPGPSGVLSFLALNKQNEPFLSKAMQKLSAEYGPVIGLILLHRKFICVSSRQAAVDALSNTELLGRPKSFDFNLRTKGLIRGVLMTDGDLWKEQRRFTIKHLKDVGVGKSSLEGMILDEIREMISDLKNVVDSSNDGVIKLDNVFTTAVLNILWVMVSSRRFERGDPKMDELASCMHGFMRFSNGGPTWLSLIPILRFIIPELSGYNKLMGYIRPIRSYVEEEVAEHQRTRQADSPRDFIDLYLEKLDEEKSRNNSTFDEEQLLATIFDIFVAGSETTSHTLGFSLLFMIFHPKIQKKVQDEIDEILQGRAPSLADRGRLPYTEATLQEIQRLGVVAPVTIPHVAEKDTKCQGYVIPKKAVVFINLWAINNDPEIWPEPTKFLPERHLNDAGEFVKSEKMLNFSLGKRSCIGETLARNSLFLFFTSFMQHFHFEFPNHRDMDYELPSLEPIPGLTLAPRPCFARVIKRSV
ncbi:methyl farnesoate epoxidase-like isoform X1 [Daphnia pulex]|uniref:methyl farnesoate epoxidase-like isoform X1 n=2 Tax=Daphnia pulex TaxID=6669 RepID=UPI001EDFDE65|nr:methyl farnesoate epoxidase-like isoform X1 [Daphnia pulex]XP_046438828.1 methyl farnesoate epoxidase-like isoform X1 [Daphnia pulex]XP_046438829.1 methyl farnesoate epoxidase-like isoform X1 [Daphnia pulex]XP_046438830.1 methyl farnesoate epoxidase-like isoform X1 [Daphnia pulex]